MAVKSLNIFYKCAAECVHLHSQKNVKCKMYSKMYKPGAIANLQGIPTNINKDGAISKIRIIAKQVILSGI